MLYLDAPAADQLRTHLGENDRLSEHLGAKDHRRTRRPCCEERKPDQTADAAQAVQPTP
jgi:hypothetical protein